MSIFEGNVCNKCGHVATKDDRKPFHRCQECNAPYELASDIVKDEAAENNKPQYNNFWRRVGAACVDGVVVFICLKAITLLNESVQAVPSSMVNVMFSMLTIGYFVIAHAHYGKTLGKHVFSIRVLHKDLSENISTYNACLREIYPILVLIIYVIYELYELMFVNLESVGMSYLYRLYIINLVLSSGGLIWFTLELVTMLFNSKRRAIHDYLANSVVVRST